MVAERIVETGVTSYVIIGIWSWTFLNGIIDCCLPSLYAFMYSPMSQIQSYLQTDSGEIRISQVIESPKTALGSDICYASRMACRGPIHRSYQKRCSYFYISFSGIFWLSIFPRRLRSRKSRGSQWLDDVCRPNSCCQIDHCCSWSSRSYGNPRWIEQLSSLRFVAFNSRHRAYFDNTLYAFLSVASSEIATTAVQYRARLITHLFNVMPQLHHRDPSIIALLGSSQHLYSPTAITTYLHCNSPFFTPKWVSEFIS